MKPMQRAWRRASAGAAAATRHDTGRRARGRSYDAVIIGGGHAASSARPGAGRDERWSSKRHVLGGAAVTEEIFPGFRFSVFSYVVSLLRPEIIRELELPKHGLDILPMDGTFTPLRPGEGPKAGGGDYLWQVNDHGRTIRELRRWSKNDAEAHEEYGKLMVDMARFIKPILSIVPPDPASNDPRPFLPLGGLLRSFQKLTERQQAVFVQLMTMSASDFLDQWFETVPLKATLAASGIIGTYQGVSRRARPTSSCTTTWARSTAPSGLGHPKGGPGHLQRRSAARRARPVQIMEAPVGGSGQDGRAVGVVWCQRGRATSVLSSVDSKLTFLGLISGTLEPEFGRRSAGSSSAAHRARSTWRSIGCPTSPACRARESTCAARSASAPAWTTWSAPTTTRSTAAGAGARTWT